MDNLLTGQLSRHFFLLTSDHPEAENLGPKLQDRSNFILSSLEVGH